MNSTIFVQPPNVITVGPNNNVEPTIVAPSKQKSMAAVIRPVPRGSGLEGSLRIDAANSEPSKTHIRTHELEDYVNWLREKIELDRNETARDPHPASSETASQPAAQSDLTQAQANVPTVTVFEVAKSETSSESGPVNAPAKVVEEIRHLPQTPHAESDYYFSSIATDAELTYKATERLAPPADPSPSEPAPEPARVQAYTTNLFQRIDSPHGPEVLLPTAHLSFPEESPVTARPLPVDPISVAETETIVATVSKAIAAVLTELPEPNFDGKIESHFQSTIHAGMIETIVSGSSVVPIDSDPLDLPQFSQSASPEIATPTENVAVTQPSKPDKEIPTYVAAWDVEDFRWPSVTNRMIISGGKAIDQLARSVFSLTSPEQQRVAITGLGRGEGTSSIAISLARWSAACGKKVLLVDADIASPTLSSDIGLAPNLSWINAVSQSLPPAEVIVRSQKTDLCVMPMSKMVSRVTWPRFIFDSLGELIDNVRNHFDLVILDMGPASQLLAELSSPKRLVDATLIVHDGVHSSEFNKTKQRLDEFGIDKFMVAQNRARKDQANVA